MKARLLVLALIFTVAADGTVLAQTPTDGLLGKDIDAQNDQDPGRIVDVRVGPDGRSEAAMVEFGGFLGIGTRKVVVPWSALEFSSNDGKVAVRVLLTRDEIRRLPEVRTNSVSK